MDKQEFIKLMTELVSIKKAEDNLNTAIRNFEPDSLLPKLLNKHI